MATPMHEFVNWLNKLSDTDPAKLKAAKASITYDHKLGLFRVYLGPRDPVYMTDLPGLRKILAGR